MLSFIRQTVTAFAMMIVSVRAVWPAVFVVAAITCHQLRARGGIMIDVVAVGASTGGMLIWDTVNTCVEMDGTRVSKLKCAQSVVASTFGIAWAVAAYQHTGNAGGPQANGHDVNRRDISFFEHVNEVLPGIITEGTVHVDALAAQQDGDNDYVFEYFNNKGLDVVHVELPKNDKRDETIEYSNKTQPADFYLARADNNTYHIVPDPYYEGKVKRGGYTGYNLLNGAITVYANSDPVASWDDAVNWANYLFDDPLKLYVTLPEVMKDNYGTDSDVWGFALSNKVDGRDGQFIMRAYHNVWTDWKSGLNWCFGAYQSNCGDTKNTGGISLCQS